MVRMWNSVQQISNVRLPAEEGVLERCIDGSGLVTSKLDTESSSNVGTTTYLGRRWTKRMYVFRKKKGI